MSHWTYIVTCCLLIASATCAPVFRGDADWQEKSDRLTARDYGVHSGRKVPLVPNFENLSREEYIQNGDPVLRFKNQTLDFEEAKLFAHMASIAYCQKDWVKAWNCSTCGLPGIKDFYVWDAFFSENWDAFAYIGYFPKNNTKVIAFRGTDSTSLWNWVENLKALRRPLQFKIPGVSDAYVHVGFHKMWSESSLKRNLTIAMAEMLSARGWDGPLVVTGHSLGGAMASMCAVFMKHTFGLGEVREYTFGSPRVGNRGFVNAFKDAITMSWRFTHQYDIVPSVPLVLRNYYHHVPVEVWQLDFPGNETAPPRTVYHVCDGGGEDMNCHGGSCFLDFCHSISDHMVYLHIPMSCID